MHFVIFSLITALCGRLEATSTTKINYLPNGQVGGYELIINNTAPAQKLLTPGRPPAFKQANKIFKTDSTFTRIDERVEGDNVYVNIQSLITKPKVKPRYPVSAILTVPSVQFNNNGAEENAKLTFAKIGPYAALILPVQNPSELAGLGNDYSIPPEIRNSVKAFIEVSDRPVSKQKYAGFSYPPKSTAVGIPSVESRRGDRGVVGGFSRSSSRVGPYEPPKYNRDVGNRDQYHDELPGDLIQESSNPLRNPAGSQIGTVQSNKGLTITLSDKNVTWFAPIAEHKLDSDKSKGDPNSLYPYGPAESSSKSDEAGGEIAQNTARTVKSRNYYSFSLSEQPPSDSWLVNENEGLQTYRSMSSLASSVPRSSKTTPLLYSSASKAISGDSRAAEVWITKQQSLGKEPGVNNPYALPTFRNPVAGGIEQSIASQTPTELRLTNATQEVPNPNFASSDKATSRDLDQSNLFSTAPIQMGAAQHGLRQHFSPHDRYADIFSSSYGFPSHDKSALEHKPSPAGPLTGSRLETLDNIVTIPSGNS